MLSPFVLSISGLIVGAVAWIGFTGPADRAFKRYLADQTDLMPVLPGEEIHIKKTYEEYHPLGTQAPHIMRYRVGRGIELVGLIMTVGGFVMQVALG